MDLRTMSFRRLRIARDPACPACAAVADGLVASRA
jgi:hypothetical protein